ncbi:MAG: metallopeptidase family protein [Planctomycetota bacterium]|nr:MAG: metallopeptidase family protein [Planctomycetota bacterium]
MTPAERDRFDALLEQVIESLPAHVSALLEEIPVIVLDRPTDKMLEDLGMQPDEADELCGLHTGSMVTERSIEEAWRLPSQIHLFRVGIMSMVGALEVASAEERLREQIRITLLHELGHEMGLDEDDLENLGYD